MRLYLHLTTAAFISIALVFDAISGYYVRNLELYEEPEETEQRVQQEQQQLQANLREQELQPMMITKDAKHSSA